MKNYAKTSIYLLLFSITGLITQAQTCFHKNSISIGLTGGRTHAEYSTRDQSGSGISKLNHREGMRGAIDPFIFEYGISNKFGVGFTSGGESYQVDGNKFYNYRAIDETSKLLSNTHYFTFDFNYHPYVTKHWDISVFSGVGTLKVNIADYPNQFATGQTSSMGCTPVNSYYAKGIIVRTGVKARYYFTKRLGVMGMFTMFSGAANPKNGPDNTFGSNYSTNVTGFATEFGLCYRFF